MLPRVVLHSLISADGMMEGFSPEGIGHYYQLVDRLGCDTCLVGSDTLLSSEALFEPEILPADEAEAPLSERAEGGGVLLVVPDSRGRLRNWSTHVQGIGARGAVVLVSQATPGEYLDYLARRNIPHIRAGADRVDYREALQQLSARFGAKAVRTDSGGVLNNILLAHGLVAELSLLISPELVGHAQRALFRTLRIPGPIGLQLTHSEQLGLGYMWLRYLVSS